jgi:hypothetical protein
MYTDYPELRQYLSEQENFESYMQKSAWLCTIKDKEAMSTVQMLALNNKMSPSTIVVLMDDGSYCEFWDDVYKNQQNVPYEIRLASYPAYFLIY